MSNRTVDQRLMDTGALLQGTCLVERFTNRREWLRARRSGIGGSDLPIIMGLSSYGSALETWAEKTGKVVPEDKFPSEAAEFGTALEPIIKNKYRQRTGRRLIGLPNFTIVRNKERPWMIASLDDVVIPLVGTNGFTGPAPFEAKTAAVWKREDWQDEPPVAYQAQASWQLAVSGWTWWSIGLVLGGQEFKWTDGQRAEDFISVAMEFALRFWECVQKDQEPKATERDTRILGLLYGKPRTGRVISLPTEAIGWDAAIRACEERIKASTQILDEAKNQMRQALGDAEAGELPDKSAIWENKLVVRAAEKEPRKGYEFRQLKRRSMRMPVN